MPQLSFNKLKAGDKYMLGPVMRYGEVLGTGEILEGATRIPTWRVKCTPMSVPVRGLVTTKDAIRGGKIRAALLGATDDDEFDHRNWIEVWAERPTGVTFMNKGGALEVHGQKMRPQLYCHHLEDLRGNVISIEDENQALQLRSSGLVSKEIEGERVKDSLLKSDPLKLEAAEAVA